ncbi:hypothetical protein DRQ09_01930 [candidate division KSB1 bacterium]|nr:MAG: hypothetical protein DRQ09_01930 [candidate division KSB1 bacterium]
MINENKYSIREKLKFFDCNCSIGRVVYPYLMDVFSVEDLIGEMDTAGIEEALVYHTVAKDCHPFSGNQLLIDEIENFNRLYPAWVVIPHYTGEMPEPKILLKEMKKNNVKAVWMYPSEKYHSFSISEWCSGELLFALENARIPLLLNLDSVTWENIYKIVNNHRNLPVIITNCGYRNNRYFYPLVEKYKNLFIEISWFMGAGAVKDFVDNFGSSQLLFGTQMPGYTGTSAVSLLTYADISESDKKAIAGKNLKSLLKEVCYE